MTSRATRSVTASSSSHGSSPAGRAWLPGGAGCSAGAVWLSLALEVATASRELVSACCMSTISCRLFSTTGEAIRSTFGALAEITVLVHGGTAVKGEEFCTVVAAAVLGR